MSVVDGTGTRDSRGLRWRFRRFGKVKVVPTRQSSAIGRMLGARMPDLSQCVRYVTYVHGELVKHGPWLTTNYSMVYGPDVKMK